ncbi:MAG: hypothetical protein J2O47_07035 [Acidimicrobiaceae bacterium]|nr:hypothetical protein [Acidimicrobiaceae bacterium]
MLSVLVASTGNWSVAVAVAVVATLVLVGLIAALVSVTRAARALREAAEDLGRQSERLLAELGGTLRDANAELERVDGLVDSAENMTETLAAASNAAYLTVAKPLIKVLAFRRGTVRAAQYLWPTRETDRVRRSRDRPALRTSDQRSATDRRSTTDRRSATDRRSTTDRRSPTATGRR